MKRNLRLILLCGALFLSGACDEPKPGTLKGVITDPNGAIIVEATIRVQHWTFDKDMHHPREKCDDELYTDDAGRFAISLQPGDYDVFIAYPGMSPVAKKIEIKSGKTATLNRQLKFDRLTKLIE
ncbi:MAG TPA: carboxypeptidase-like regulatory domain-containing protein [Terriglobales bacterium]|nr:carboxypeptidase-like regulatory domain-containing protein [Terriglobales bacterium]